MLQLYRMLCTGLLLVVPVTCAGSDPVPVPFDPAHPPGRLVDIGGYHLHIYCRGPETGPSVVFDAGLGGFSMDWLYVQDALVGEMRVCAYDRAGYGWSDTGPAPRDTEQISGELAALLERSGVAPPYVLVGHSFGGYNIEYFAATNPGATAGLVLVDASHPLQSERLPAVPGDMEQSRRGTLHTSFDPRVIREHYPEEMWYGMGALMASGKAIATQQREFRNFSVSAAQVRMAGALPQVPLVVVSRGRRVWPETPLGDAMEAEWKRLQIDLAAAVPGSRQVIAPASGHLVHLDEPDVVAAAVRDVVQDSCRLRGACLQRPVRVP